MVEVISSQVVLSDTVYPAGYDHDHKFNGVEWDLLSVERDLLSGGWELLSVEL